MLPSNAMNDQVLDETKLRAMVKYLRIGLLVVGVAVVVGGASLLLQSYRRSAAEKGFSALAAIETLETDAANQAQTLNIPAEEAMKKWPDEKKADYEGKLNAVVAEYGSSTAGATAALKLARWKLVNEKFDEAVPLYEGVLKHATSSTTMLMRAMAFEGLGATREAQKNFEEAVKVYSQAIDMKENPFKPLAYMGKARAAAALGKKDEAKAALEAVAKEFPNSNYERRARALQALLVGG